MAAQYKKIKALGFLCLGIVLCTQKAAFAFDKRLAASLSHYIMANVYDQRGDLERAIAEYRKALTIDYKNAILHLNLAVTHLKKNDIPKAITELNLAIKFNQEAVEPHAILALLYFSQENSELATQEYELALKNASKLEPENVDIYKSLGAVYLRQKKLKEAENTYRFILTLVPDDSESHFYLANIYDEQKRRDLAIEELKKALELRYEYPEALNYLGYIYVEENGDLDKAQVMIKKALEMDPENGAYVDSLGWLYFKQGKYEESIELLKRACLLLEDPVIYHHLGDAYDKLGDKENAKIYWKKSQALNPNQEAIKEKIKKLEEQDAKDHAIH